MTVKKRKKKLIGILAILFVILISFVLFNYDLIVKKLSSLNKSYIENYCAEVLQPGNEEEPWRNPRKSVYKCTDSQGEVVYRLGISWGLGGSISYVDEVGNSLCEITWDDLSLNDRNSKCTEYKCESTAICSKQNYN